MSTSCKKLVAIAPPSNSITTTQVFADSADAAAALLGVYANLRLNTSGPGGTGFGSGSITLFCGLSADELINFNADPELSQFASNTLQYNNGLCANFLWNSAYQYIYQTNAIIEGLNASSNVSASVRNRFSAEAKFLRAFCYFYLVNLYGDIPLITNTLYKSNALAPRVKKQDIYQFITTELMSVKDILPDNFASGKGERIRVNKWAAMALLSRVYLYTGNWVQAANYADSVISQTSLFSLTNDLNAAFSTNSSEAILQWQLNTSLFPFNATPEGVALIPPDSVTNPNYYIRKELLGAFEFGDKRRELWLDSSMIAGNVYYYPFKYKIGPAQWAVNSTPTEYYMVLRLSEQFLIRAEARTYLNDLDGAIADLNVIRTRAGLSSLTISNQDSIRGAVMQERKVELFCEWGNRWFDLKRTQQATNILAPIKPKWQSYQQLYPVPKEELLLDPNLTQNDGYH